MPPSKIGDSFPASLKADFAERNVRLGAVLKFYCNRAGKEKRLIYIGENAEQTEIAMLFINTEINEYHFPTLELKAEHFKLEVSDREYLTHDSFVNCSDFVLYSREDIFSKCAQTPSIHIGSLSDQDMSAVISMVKNSKVLTKKEKKKFGFM